MQETPGSDSGTGPARQARFDPQDLQEVKRELNREAIRLVMQRFESSRRRLSSFLDRHPTED